MNPETENRIEEAREFLDAGWDDERARRTLARVKQGYARRRTAKVGGAMTAIAAVFLAIPIVIGNLANDTVPFHDDVEVSTNTIELADEVRITPLETTAKVTVAEVSEKRVELQMEDGRAHFDIESVPGRSYVITAGVVEIEVVGTSFDVEKRSEEVVISVHEGTVAVRSQKPGEAFLMNAGDTRTVALEPVRTAEAEVPEPARELEEEAPEITEEEPEPRAKPPKRWRKMTQKKEWKSASKLILDDPDSVDRREIGELFDAADAMRRAGYHDLAAQYLAVIADEHASDSRAAMAAHTRGRILARRLDNPCEAAGAFAKAQAIGLDGVLQRDALANEAENLIACGKPGDAAERIERYRSTYPSGPHLPLLEDMARPAEEKPQ